MSLELGQVAVGAVNDGQHTLISAVVDQQPVLVRRLSRFASAC
jgi:hypothetical protein